MAICSGGPGLSGTRMSLFWILLELNRLDLRPARAKRSLFLEHACGGQCVNVSTCSVSYIAVLVDCLPAFVRPAYVMWRQHQLRKHTLFQQQYSGVVPQHHRRAAGDPRDVV